MSRTNIVATGARPTNMAFDGVHVVNFLLNWNSHFVARYHRKFFMNSIGSTDSPKISNTCFATGVGKCPIFGILDITWNSSHLVDIYRPLIPFMVGWCEQWGHLFNDPCAKCLSRLGGHSSRSLVWFWGLWAFHYIYIYTYIYI